MKRLFKNIICVLLSLLMLLTACPLTALATSSGDYSYTELTTKDGTTYIELLGYTGSSKSITLPTELDGKKVVGTNYNFSPFTTNKPTEIIVPEGYEYIGGIRGFKNLSITLPSSLKIINDLAFYNTTIKSINFPEGLEAIGYSAFEGASFTNKDIVLPNSLKYIDNLAFASTNITSIHLGKNVNFATTTSEYEYGVDIVGYEQLKYMDNARSFVEQCSSLQKISVDNDNPYFTVEDNSLLSKDKSILWAYPAGLSNTKYVVPSCVKIIAPFAYSGANFDSFTLSNSVTKLYCNSFTNIISSEFSFENNCGLTEIPSYSFYQADIAAPIEIPNTVELIGSSAFSCSSITELNWQEGSNCNTIEQYAFAYSNLNKATIPSTVVTMGEDKESNVFSNCTSLQTVVFEDNSNVAIWGENLFENCSSLNTIDTGKSSTLQAIYCSFSDTKITNLDFSNCYALSSVSTSTFKNNNTIESVDLSNTDLYRLSSTFYGATNLKMWCCQTAFMKSVLTLLMVVLTLKL